MSPVAVKLPVEGSYSSALDGKVDPGQLPPVSRTLPSGRRVAVCPVRAVNNSPVGVKVPVCCAKATWQNDRTRINAADLLVISFLDSRKAVDLYDIWNWILSNNNGSAHVFETFGKVTKK